MCLQREVQSLLFRCSSQRKGKNSLSYALKPSSKTIFLDDVIHHFKCLRLVPIMWPNCRKSSRDSPGCSQVQRGAGRIPFALGCAGSAARGAGHQKAHGAGMSHSRESPECPRLSCPILKKRNIPESLKFRKSRVCSIYSVKHLQLFFWI